MTDFPLPPAGIEAVTYTYLFQMAQQLNLALQNLDSGNFSQETQDALRAGVSVQSEELPQQTNALRSLVIKTADTVRAEMDRITASLAGVYVAQSDFGSYVQNLSAYLEANPEAITQYYKFAATLQADLSRVDTSFGSYKSETEGYIRTGIVYYQADGVTPVYGVAVGQNLTARSVNGESVIDPVRFRSTFTANRLSFWQDAQEVAYVSNNQLYIREVTVLDRLTLGDWVMEDGDSGLVVRYGG